MPTNSGATVIGGDGSTNSTTSTNLAGGSVGAQPYQVAANETEFAYPNTDTVSFWLDGNRTDSYTADGTELRPYKTLSALIAGSASVAAPFVIYCAPATYAYTGSPSFPAYFMTIYGNGSTWNFTGNITVNAAFNISNLNTTATGTLTYAATSATESVRNNGSLIITGGIFTSGYEHFNNMSILSNTLITLNSGATSVFNHVVGTPRWTTASGVTATTVLTITDSQSILSGAYTNINMSNGGLLIVRGFIATNNGTLVNINLSGSSAVSSTVANFVTGISAAWVTAGSAYTYVAPDVLIALLSGTALHFVGVMEVAQYSLTAQSASIGATTVYTTTATGIYRLSAAVQTTTAGTAGTVLVTVKGVSSSTTDLTTLGSTQSASQLFYSAASATLQYSTTVISDTGGVYRVDAVVERLM